MRLIPFRERLIVVIVIALDVSRLFLKYDTNSYVHSVGYLWTNAIARFGACALLLHFH